MIKKIGNFLFFALFIGIMAFAFSGTVKGFVFARLWDGRSTLDCGGDQVMTFKDRTLQLTSSPVFSIGGNCELNLINCQISAPVVVSAGGNARVRISGGTLTGSQTALQLGGNATVDVKDARIVGRIQRGGSARVNGLPEVEKEQAKDDLASRFGSSACAGLIACYQKANFVGNLAGRVTATVDADGRMTDARVDGDVPAEIKPCLLATARSKQISGYDGKPGRLICNYAGMLAGGTQMLSLDPRFER